MGITVIITDHLEETKPYLDACLESLSWQRGVEFDTVLLSSAPKRPQVDRVKSPKSLVIIHDTELNNPTKKIKYAMEFKPADYYLLLSNDVVLSPDCIAGMFWAASKGCLVTPLSNNDNGWHFVTEFPCGPSAEFSPMLIDYAKHQEPSRNLLIPARDGWFPFYCVMISAKVFEAVGFLDPALDCRFNDVDFCHRALKQGYNAFINTGVFALHFGSKTISKTETPESFAAADAHFAEKYKDRIAK